MSGSLSYGNKYKQLDQDALGRLNVNVTNFPASGGGSTNLPLTTDGYAMMALMTKLSKEFDSIDVGKMSKGGAITAHNAIVDTKISGTIPCSGFNAVILHVVISGTGKWKIDIQNAVIDNGIFVDAFDGEKQLSTGEITASRSILFRGITDYIKIAATEITDGATCTIKAQPLNV